MNTLENVLMRSYIKLVFVLAVLSLAKISDVYAAKLVRFTPCPDVESIFFKKYGFAALKISFPLNDTEKACSSVNTLHLQGLYAQLGYGVNAVKGVNLAPSITYLLANYPKKVTWKYPNGE
ncbi:MAG: hypothetical protein EZS28_044289, partial [Streblomastix strix]